MNKIILKLLIGFLIVIGVSYLLITSIDPSKLSVLLRNFSFAKLVLLLSLSAMISILKSWRFFILLKHNGIQLNFWNNLKIYLASQTTSPLPGGETMRGVLINKETGSSILKISGSVITQAYIEFLSAAVIVIIGSVILKSFRVPAIVTLIVIILLTLFLMHKKIPLIIQFLTKYFKKMSFLHQRVNDVQKGFKKNVVSDSKLKVERAFTASLTIGILTNILGGLIIYLIVDELKLNLNFLQSIFIYASSIVLTTLSVISPGGVGVTEGGMIGILLNFKVDLESSVAVILIFRVVTLFFSVLVGSLFLSFFYGRRLFIK